jgi:hypothetical protein
MGTAMRKNVTEEHTYSEFTPPPRKKAAKCLHCNNGDKITKEH